MEPPVKSFTKKWESVEMNEADQVQCQAFGGLAMQQQCITSISTAAVK
jgi:hypothetical protein